MRKNIFLLSTILFLVSCNQSSKFKVEGIVDNTNNEVIILEQNGLIETTVIDSVKLDNDGSFSFKAPRPEYPDFYRLRIGTKTIDFAVDSCEVISIKANFNNFSTGYNIQGSQTNSDILKLKSSLSAIQSKVNTISSETNAETRNAKLTEIETDIEVHKAMARKLILQNPRSSAAYFAIYQKINNSYLFSPYVKSDKPFCAAVATSYNTFMPEYIRSKNLYSLVMDAIKTERKEQNDAVWRNMVENSSTGYIDIALNDKNGKVRKLSELEGKVILIDFSAYEMENNVQYTFELRDLYNKFNSRGFEIYQISLDRSKLLWQESVANIPWVCVRDEQGLKTQYISSYNVQSIPTLFLMDRKGVIVSRVNDFKTLEVAIAKLL
ncbi:MAG: thioredoxin-like domain-containing protein [Paludibacter sp.]